MTIIVKRLAWLALSALAFPLGVGAFRTGDAVVGLPLLAFTVVTFLLPFTQEVMDAIPEGAKDQRQDRRKG